MDYKKWLVEGFCPVDKYICLMPVEYEGEENDDKTISYHKNRMVCRHALSGKCTETDKCVFFEKAPDVLDKDANWYEE